MANQDWEHTPGPWVVGPKIHGFDFTITNPKGDAELGNWLVAGVRWNGNAHLIAAAPDLLAACERLVNDSMFKDHPDASQMALNAIAKATGAA